MTEMHLAPGIEPTSPVTISSGSIKGLTDGETSWFKGIPYGASTAGANRFRPPQPAPSWSATRDCFEFGPTAPPGRFVLGAVDTANATPMTNPETLKLAAALMGASSEPVPHGEDCLVLNVFTPGTDDRARPVMVWLHGGAFAMGSASSELYDGRAMCRGGVVVVTLNHRLGALGFLYLDELSPDFAGSGNAGMLDIVQALEWVRDNIAAFGGDPTNVTVFGESGGGQKISVLMAMAAARGLFHKAIIQSGPAEQVVPAHVATAAARRVLASLSIDPNDATALQTVPIDELSAAAGAATVPVGMISSVFSPVRDGTFVPHDPFSVAALKLSGSVPLVIGTNKDEMVPFVVMSPGFGSESDTEAEEKSRALAGAIGPELYAGYLALLPNENPSYRLATMLGDMRFWSGSIRIAEVKCDQNEAPVFMYRLVWEAPGFGGRLRSPHGLDLSFVFGNIEIARALVGDSDVPEQISTQMMDAWLTFAKTGNPSTSLYPWPAYDRLGRHTMRFDENTTVVEDPEHLRRLFWAERS